MASDDIDDFELLDLRDVASRHSLAELEEASVCDELRTLYGTYDFEFETKTQTTKGRLTMAKELFAGKVEQTGTEYTGKVENGVVEISVKQDLGILIDKAAEAVPGDSAIEQMVVGIAKTAVKAI